MSRVRSGFRSLWSIPRFQHIASVVREQRGNWKGCSNQSSGDNNAVVPAKLQRLKDFDAIDKFQPIISLRKGFDNDIVMKLSMSTAENSDYEAVQSTFVDPMETEDRDQFIENLRVYPERVKDLEEQLKCSNEEVFFLRERLRKLEEENKNLDHEASMSVNEILRMRYRSLFKETYERD